MRSYTALSGHSQAVHCLIGAAEGRDFVMHARIGMLRALNRNVERVFDSSRKDNHWGKRKLKRDSQTANDGTESIARGWLWKHQSRT